MSDACMNVRIVRECGIAAASRNPSSSYTVSMNRLDAQDQRMVGLYDHGLRYQARFKALIAAPVVLAGDS
jgi:hypothetical protein